MTKFRKLIDKSIGRRNLPFVAAAATLALIVILLMYLSPSTYSDHGPRNPSVVSGE